jgi:serine/threonine protein kinase
MQRKQKQAENGEVITSSTGCHPKKQQKTDGGKLKSIETITSGSCISNSGSSVLSQLTGQNNQQKTDKNGNKRTFLDLYEVYNVIGVGGGGMVYSGRRIADKLPVAIKRVMREKVKRWETVQGYQVPQEIALMLRCYGHPGVIRLVDWYECLDSFILIMERPERAVDLFDYIREVGRINETEAARIFSSVLDATQHIMACGVVHRDLKDENIIMNRDTGEAKIIDFGCGTLLRENAYRDFSGTPEFYPPEWFTTREYFARTAAVWSLGVLLFDMLQGEIPFKQKEKIVENNPSYKHSLSPEAKHLVQWLMSTDPKNRPTMEDIVNHPWLSQYRNQVA